MKILKLFLFWIIIIVLMILSWSVGSVVGNAITKSYPPPPADPVSAFQAFLIVCVVNSLLVTVLIWTTRRYKGWMKWVSLIVFVFTIQFLLTQMETYFFSKSFTISNDQIVSILILGIVASFVTVGVGVLVFEKFDTTERLTLEFELKNRKTFVPVTLLAGCLVYPLIYLVFGYYIAWQNENLRMFYSGTTQITPLFTQSSQSFSNGIFFFQMLRGSIWLLVSAPIILMLQHLKIFQYLLVGLFCALLPGILLLIPNPYMPADIALSHFYETTTSNFLWGIVMTYVVNRHVAQRSLAKVSVLS
jgi:hypothetical protein